MPLLRVPDPALPLVRVLNEGSAFVAVGEGEAAGGSAAVSLATLYVQRPLGRVGADPESSFRRNCQTVALAIGVEPRRAALCVPYPALVIPAAILESVTRIAALAQQFRVGADAQS